MVPDVIGQKFEAGDRVRFTVSNNQWAIGTVVRPESYNDLARSFWYKVKLDGSDDCGSYLGRYMEKVNALDLLVEGLNEGR